MFMKGDVMIAQHFMRRFQECAAECACILQEMQNACTTKNKQNKKQKKALTGAEPKVHRDKVKTV